MKRNHIAHAVLAAFLLAGTSTAIFAQSNNTPKTSASEVQVVYHVSETASMRDALNNITNQLATNPATRITLLANSRGVFGLVGGERDRQGEYASTISELQAKGVKFVACRTSMKKNNIAESALLPNVSTVPAGVVELTRLQAQEHYAYIKP
jgi:intracellular sulfur oxidation DsrE/DsrF family protein